MLFALLLALSTSLSHAESLYATDPVQGLRWPGATQQTMSLSRGDEVEVVLRDGDLIRVRKGTDFGWVQAAFLTATAPAGTTKLTLGAPATGLPVPSPLGRLKRAK